MLIAVTVCGCHGVPVRENAISFMLVVVLDVPCVVSGANAVNTAWKPSYTANSPYSSFPHQNSIIGVYPPVSLPCSHQSIAACAFVKSLVLAM